MAWGKAGSTTTTTTGDNVTVSGLSDNKFYMVLGHHLPSGNFRTTYRFNNDSGSNYALRKSEDGGSENLTNNITDITLGNQDAAYDYFDVSYLVNISTEEKLMINVNMRNGGNGAGNAPNIVQAVGKWDNTSSVISRIDAVNDQGGSYASGSNNSVLGSDLTTSAGKPTNIQVGSRFEETDTRKIYHYEENNPTYTPDLSSSSGWALTNGGGTLSIANDEITISANSNADNPVATFDLGSTLSDTKWLMTFKLVYSGLDNTNIGQGVIGGIGISDLATYSAVDGWYPAGLAYISYEILAHASSGTYAQTQVAGGNSSGRSETTGADIPSPYSATQYVKLYRLTSTTARMEYYGQADYSDTPTTINVTMSNAPSGLRYLFLRLMYQNVTSTNTIVASEFKIYNDTNTVPEATEWKELGT